VASSTKDDAGSARKRPRERNPARLKQNARVNHAVDSFAGTTTRTTITMGETFLFDVEKTFDRSTGHEDRGSMVDARLMNNYAAGRNDDVNNSRVDPRN